MSQKIVYKKGNLLGNSVYNSEAMRDITKRDQ